MFAIYSNDKVNKPFIEIRKLPETLEDVFLVAHEMCHAIKDFDGNAINFGALQPSNYKKEELFDMSCKLGSMLDDPLIDSFLKDKYDFNPARFYANIIMPDINNSLDQYGDPTHEWHIFKRALLYAQFSLQMDSVSDIDVRNNWDELKVQYLTRRPLTAKIGEDIYMMSNRDGYDTKEKQRNLFNKIFNKYTIRRDVNHCDKLSDILRVV